MSSSTSSSESDGATEETLRFGWGVLLALFLVVSLVPAFAVAGLNATVDPLWYGAGNQLFAENFPYNERFSKANRFLQNASDYDCVVLGSSRITLLDVNEIEGARCFNFAVSNGTIEEYAEILDFVTDHTELSLVVVGADAFNFSDHGHPNALPAFVRAKGTPVSRLEAYLSLDVLEFTLRAIVSRDQRTRFYDQTFTGDVMPQRGPFDAPEALDPDHPYGGLARSKTNTSGPFFPERATDLWSSLRAEHPGVRFVGYVPPLASHFMAHVRAAGNLDGYTGAIWNASRGLDALWDFSVPSTLTRDLANTYDGSHYFRAANDRVAGAIARGDAGASNFALPVHEMSLERYRALMDLAIREFAALAYGD